VIANMCERCKSKKVVANRVAFEGSDRHLCPDCLHSFSLWLHGASTWRRGPNEAGVTS
jgi:transposase-like protein